jgi:hypothetical protein
MGKFKGDDHAIEDHGRAKTGADAEEEHSATLITAEGLHGGVVDEAERLAQGLLIGEANPSGGEVVRLGERMIMDDRARVAYGDAVVGPALGGSEDIFRHLLGSHGGTGRNFDGNEFVARGDFDVGTADVDYEDFHIDLDVSNDRCGGLVS